MKIFDVSSPTIAEILQAPHVLIAGATGSGKSVLLNSIIYQALQSDPQTNSFIFIDLKRVELIDYYDLPHTLYYADTAEKAKTALDLAVAIIEDRFTEMQTSRQKQYRNTTEKYNIYVVIDEYALLTTVAKKECTKQLMQIAQIGRAANVHLILATQRPTRDIITGAVKVNLDCRIALRCSTAIDSRNIIDRPGAEQLPKYGKALFLKHGYLKEINVDMISDQDIKDRCQQWIDLYKNVVGDNVIKLYA